MSILRRISLTLAVMLVVVAGAELGVRAAAGRLREPLLYWNWEAQNKIAAMDSLRSKGGASIVFVGSSMMQAAAQPEVATSMLGLSRPAFNAALNGSGMRAWDLWIRSVVIPRLKPKIVVLGFNSEGLNDNGTQQDDFYGRMISSPLGAALDARGDALDRFESWWTQRSYLVRYRLVLRRPYDAFLGEDIARKRAAVSRLGRLVTLRTFLARPYQREPSGLVEGWERQLHDYSPGGRQLELLDSLVRELSSHGIKVVLVKMPVTQDIVPIHPHGAADRARFTAMIEAFATTHPVTFFDAERALGGATTFFVDPVHVNTQGARLFTTRIAEVLRHVGT